MTRSLLAALALLCLGETAFAADAPSACEADGRDGVLPAPYVLVGQADFVSGGEAWYFEAANCTCTTNSETVPRTISEVRPGLVTISCHEKTNG